MASRMERYKNNNVKSSRSSRNKSLYNSIYSYDDKYSNIEGVASIDKNNEIDISKVKKMIETRENNTRSRNFRNSSNDNVDNYSIVRNRYKEDTDRNYDIIDVLKNAKENKEPDNKERVLNNTNYEILKTLNLSPKEEVKENKEEDLKSLIETISNTSMINKNGDPDLDMFSDLASDDTKVGDVKDFTEFTSMMGEKTMDDSFFTGGVKLKKADFVNGEKKKGSFVKKFFVAIFILLIISAIVVFALNYFHVINLW